MSNKRLSEVWRKYSAKEMTIEIEALEKQVEDFDFFKKQIREAIKIEKDKKKTLEKQVEELKEGLAKLRKVFLDDAESHKEHEDIERAFKYCNIDNLLND